MGTKVQINLGYARNYEKLIKKKHFSQHLAYQLYYKTKDLDLKDSLAKSYQNTIYCANRLIPNGEGKLTAHYCKNRWCPVCQSIRIAKLINGYAPMLKEMKDIYFVTLTAPTVKEKDLKERVKTFGNEWRKISTQRYWRENKPKGIRKAECTVRPNGFYHYHFHVIIDGKENAEWLLKQWLKRFPKARENAQDIKKVDEGGYLELFKYFTKLIATDKSTNKRYIDFERLDVVFRTLRGTRVYQPFGGVTMVDEDFEETELEAQIESDDLMRIWTWVTDEGYVSEDGEMLSSKPLPTWVENLCGKIEK